MAVSIDSKVDKAKVIFALMCATCIGYISHPLVNYSKNKAEYEKTLLQGYQDGLEKGKLLGYGQGLQDGNNLYEFYLKFKELQKTKRKSERIEI